MRNCSQDLPPKMQPGLAIGNVVGIGHRKCGWDSPSEMRLGHCRNDDRDSPLQGLVKRDQEGKTTAKDTVTSPEKERVTPHQEVKNRMLTCFNIPYLSLTWNEVLQNGGETVLVLS